MAWVLSNVGSWLDLCLPRCEMLIWCLFWFSGVVSCCYAVSVRFSIPFFLVLMRYATQNYERERQNERREQNGQRISHIYPILCGLPRPCVTPDLRSLRLTPSFFFVTVVRFIGSTLYMIIRLFAGEWDFWRERVVQGRQQTANIDWLRGPGHLSMNLTDIILFYIIASCNCV